MKVMRKIPHFTVDPVMKRVLLYGIILLYRILLDVHYCLWISKYYAYWGMTSTFSLPKVVVSYVFFAIVLIPFVLLHSKARKMSDYVMLIWDFMYFIPGTAYITYETCSSKYVLFYLTFYLCLNIVNELLPKEKYNIVLNRWLASSLFILLVVLTIFFVVRYNGFRFKMDFNNVYEIRSSFSLRELPLLFRYMKNPMANLIPILLYLAVKRKKFIVAAILFFLQLGIYSMGATKINLIFLLVSIGMLFVKINSSTIIVGFGCLLAVSALLSSVSSRPMDGFITDKLIRRMMITPNNLSLEYFNFFQTNSVLVFKTSLLKSFVSSQPFDKPISYVIGEYIGTGANANNGLAGDAYANLGMLSILVYPLIYGFLFWIINCFSSKVDKEIGFLVAFIIAVILIDSAFFTSLFTHGIVLLILFLIIYPYRAEVI